MTLLTMTTRNYKQDQPKKNVPVLKCFMCNKKYRSEERRKKHVEQSHYFDTQFRNEYKFDEITRAHICDLAVKYFEAITSGITYEFLGTTANQERFTQRLLNSNILHNCDWSRALDDLQRFFNIGIPYYDTNFCPNLLIDFLWHALMQDKELYTQLCQKTVGQVVPHCAETRSEDIDQLRYTYFKEVYQHRYKVKPYLPEGASVTGDVATDLAAQAQKERQKHQNRIDAEKRRTEDYMRKQEEYKLEQEKKRIKRQKILDEFCTKVGIDISWAQYYDWYEEAYRRTGYVGEKLKRYVARLTKTHNEKYDMMGSTC